MTSTHICLVSGQPIPNLVPLRMDGLKPDKVVLCVSPDMAVEASRLEEVISSWQIAVEKRPVAPYDLTSARDTFLNLLVELEAEQVTLNVTGGTKIMAFAAFEVFRGEEKPILYVDTQNKRVQLLSPETRMLDFPGVIKVKPYLRSYGQKIKEDDTDRERVQRHRPVVDALLNGLPEFEHALSAMNRLTAPLRDAPTFPVTKDISSLAAGTRGFEQLTSLFERHHLLTRTGKTLRFAALDDVKFLSGDWLAEHVFRLVMGLSPTDVRMGVEVEWDQKGPKPPKNEYDVVFTHGNRLYLIECKTKRFDENEERESDQNLVYKLESLRDAAGGLYGKGMLVSYRPLTDAQKKRLAANRLEYCDGPSLHTLEDKLKRWVR